MAALATVEELRLFLELPGLVTARGELMLDGASAAVRRYTKRAWEAVEGDVADLDGNGSSSLLLPKLPVRAVSSVLEGPGLLAPLELELGTDAPAVEWNTDGILRRTDGGIFYRRLRYYRVTYDHGEAPPDDVKLVVLRLCARAVTNPEGLTQENVAGYGSTFGFDTTRLAVLSDADRRELFEYRP